MLRLYGAGHDAAVGCVLSNFPPGIAVDKEYINRYVDRRAPGGLYGSGRKETDVYELLSGIDMGVTTGEDIEIRIANKDVRKSDYHTLRHRPRPSHGDYVSYVKYNKIDSGGGLFSGRMTAPLVVAGALCDLYLKDLGVLTGARLAQIGTIQDAQLDYAAITPDMIERLNEARLPLIDGKKESAVRELLAQLREEKDATGGEVQLFMTGLPAGLGAPLFGNLEAKISGLLYAVGGVKSVSFGLGEKFKSARASAVNDEYYYDDHHQIKTYTNYNGGIVGGITTGMPLVLSCVMKPTPSIGKVQNTVDLETRTNTTIVIQGRHDACIALRGLWALRACLCIVMADTMMAAKNQTPSLESLRRDIDEIDSAMAALFNRRMNLSAVIGTMKQQNRKEILDSEREEKVLRNVVSRLDEQNKPYGTEYIQKIMELSKRKQEKKQ